MAAAASTGTIDRGAGVQSCTYVALANVMTSGEGTHVVMSCVMVRIADA